MSEFLDSEQHKQMLQAEQLRDLKRKRRVERAALKMFIKAWGPIHRGKDHTGKYYYSPSGVMIKVEVAVAARRAMRGRN